MLKICPLMSGFVALVLETDRINTDIAKNTKKFKVQNVLLLAYMFAVFFLSKFYFFMTEILQSD